MAEAAIRLDIHFTFINGEPLSDDRPHLGDCAGAILGNIGTVAVTSVHGESAFLHTSLGHLKGFLKMYSGPLQEV